MFTIIIKRDLGIWNVTGKHCVLFCFFLFQTLQLDSIFLLTPCLPWHPLKKKIHAATLRRVSSVPSPHLAFVQAEGQQWAHMGFLANAVTLVFPTASCPYFWSSIQGLTQVWRDKYSADISLLILIVLRQVLCNPGWSWTWYTDEDDLDLLSLPPLLPNCCDYTNMCHKAWLSLLTL